MARTLVGRMRELEEMTAALDDARGHAGRVLLLVGEAGIGKTRLCDELSRRARDGGFHVAWGRAWEEGGAPAFWPWIQLLRESLPGDPAAVKELLAAIGPGAVDVAALLPELLPLVPVELMHLAGDASRFRLFEATAALVRALAVRRPLLLVFDDLHVADVPSVQLLAFVARAVRNAPVVVVATYRDAEARAQPQLDELLIRLARDGARIPLRRLTEDEVQQLLRGSLGDDAAGTSAAAVHRATEGNPLFVVELVGAWAGPFDDDETTHARLRAQGGVRAAIQGHLARLSPETTAVLQVAAVIGREVDRALLAACVDVDADELARALGEAAATGVVEEQGLGRVRFVHILLRDALDRGLTVKRRADAHRRAAQAIARRAGAHNDEDAAALARHHLAAGDVEEGVALSLRAAARANRLLAFEEAAEQLARARTALEAEGLVAPARAGALLVEEAEARIHGGDVATSHALCARAAERARAAGDATLLGRAALAYGLVPASGVVDKVHVALLQEALLAGGDAETPLRARLLARLAAAMQPSARPDDSVVLAREAVAAARRLGDERCLLDVLYFARAAHWDSHPLQERLALDEETVALATKLGAKAQALHASTRLSLALLEAGRVDEANERIEACARVAAEFRQPTYQWRTLLLRSLRAQIVGRFDEADRFIAQAEEVAQRADDQNARTTLVLHRLGRLRAQGRIDELRTYLPLALQQLEGIAELGMFRVLFALLVATTARDVAATREAFAHLGALPALAPGAAEAAALLGDVERVVTMYDALRPLAGSWLVSTSYSIVCEGPIDRLLGVLAMVAGRLDDAEAHFVRAAAASARAGSRPFLAACSVEHAALLAVRGGDGDAARARILLDDAADTAAALAMPALAARVREVRASLTGASATPANAHAGVTTSRSSAVRSAELADAFALEGEYWTIQGNGPAFRLKDSRGLQLLVRLLREPGRDVHVLDLAVDAGAALRDDAAGPVLDDEAKRAYRDRLVDLKDQLADAERHNDTARAARAQAQIDALTTELSRAFGLGGRARKPGAASERARVNVKRRLEDAIGRIEEQDAALGRLLRRTVRTGTYCAFVPEDARDAGA